MAWSFAQGQQGWLAPTGRPLKRPASRECLAPHVKHPAVAAAVPPGGNTEAAAVAATAAAAAPTADGIDVAAVAAKHGSASLGCVFMCMPGRLPAVCACCRGPSGAAKGLCADHVIVTAPLPPTTAVQVGPAAAQRLQQRPARAVDTHRRHPPPAAGHAQQR